MTLTELIAALEAATCGSRELDGPIALAIGWTNDAWPEGRERKPWWRAPGTRRNEWFRRNERPPEFSRSLDAALTLVPEGAWTTIRIPNGGGVQPYTGKHGAYIELPHKPYSVGCPSAATPALALCIASLKARQ